MWIRLAGGVRTSDLHGFLHDVLSCFQRIAGMSKAKLHALQFSRKTILVINKPDSYRQGTINEQYIVLLLRSQR